MVEVVVAVALLVLAIGGAYRVLAMSMSAQQTSRDYYIGIVIANNQIERAKSLTFGNLPLLQESNQRVDRIGTLDKNGRFLRTTLVEDSFGGDADLTRVTVIVELPPPRYSGSGSSPPSVFVSTLFTSYLDP